MRKLLKSASGMVLNTNVQSEKKKMTADTLTSDKLSSDEIVSFQNSNKALQGYFLSLLFAFLSVPDSTSCNMLIHSYSEMDVLVS